jgi:hypothetical protein
MILSILFHSALLLIFFLVSFKQPQAPPPVIQDEGIEVNLGNSDIGFGDIQPLAPGEPAPDASQDNPAQSEESFSENTESETAQNDDPETPVINKQETQNKTSRTNTDPSNNNNKNNSTTQTTTENKQRDPKATFKGGNGTGGNNSDEFNNSRNQGISGGAGDQGNPNGNPNSDNYNGNGGNGNGGATVHKGNRKIVKSTSFRGDLPKATIYAEISVDADGKGSFIDFAVTPKSTSRESRYATAIKNYLPGIEFDKTGNKSTVTVKFVFDVKN